ncbi:MAG: amidohydrolase family protein [Dehalococcoidales bacterium]|jgi:dihydroorotase|nr:amidohydrolase family protein [Dehalococcoidales bacterium]
MKKFIIKNAKIIDPSENLNEISDLLIDDGKIIQISKNIDISNLEIIDLNKKTLIPGLIDLHVHYRDPGETYKENIESGSKSSAKGGFTTVLMMANTTPTMDCVEVLEKQKDIINKNASIRVLQTASVTVGRKGEKLVDIDALSNYGVVGFSDDGDVVENPELFTKGLLKAKNNNKLIFQHCEDTDLINNGVINDSPISIRLGLNPRSSEAESKIIERDIKIAKKNKYSLYFQHISSKKSIELIRNAKKLGINIIAEVTPHHLFMNELWTYGLKGNVPEFLNLNSYDTNTRVNPPLRTEEDRKELISALKDGTINLIATDHAPHSQGDKLNTFEDAPAGINGAELALSTMLTLVNNEELSIQEVIKFMSNAPGELLNKIMNLKVGKIKKGYEADFTIIDESKSFIVSKKTFLSKSINSPLINSELFGKVYMTIYGGKIVYKEH